MLRASYLLILLLYYNGYWSQDTNIYEGYTYVIEDGEVTSDTILTSKKYFNVDHKLLKEITYWMDEGFNEKTIVYDANEKKAAISVSLQDATFSQHTKFIRDENGEILKQIFTKDEETSTLLHKNEYSKKGYLVKSTVTPVGAPESILSQLVGENKMKYDKNGNILQLVQFVGGVKQNEQNYTYDKLGNQIEFEFVDLKNKRVRKFIRVFNEQNKLVSESIYDDNQLFSTEENEWQASVLVKQTSTYVMAGFIEITEFKQVR